MTGSCSIGDGVAAVLTATQEHELATVDGAYRLRIFVPAGTPPAGGYPVIYLLDPNAAFATLVEAVMRAAHRPAATGVRPVAVVGIGHDEGGLYDQPRRRADYTLPGAETFLALLLDEVRPFVERLHPIAASRATLIGHSLAGWFCLWAMTRRPGAFESHVALSPSIWWDEPRLAAGIMEMADAGARAFLGVGEWEGGLAPWQQGAPGSDVIAVRRGERDMIGATRRIAEQLTARFGAARVSFTEFPDEDHASVVAVGLTRALRFICRAH